MDYSATIQTHATPAQAARAIRDDLKIWWSTRVDYRADGFTVRFNKSHATFAHDPGGSPEAFSWTCTDAHMLMEGVADAAEWSGTQLIWRIAPTPKVSTITLTHRGLNPDIACFDICSRGWQHFFETSLKRHLEGETALPETSGA